MLCSYHWSPQQHGLDLLLVIPVQAFKLRNLPDSARQELAEAAAKTRMPGKPG